MTTTETPFTRFLIKIPPQPSLPISATHEIRARKNSPKYPTVNDARSLFLKNIPVDSTEGHFRSLFTQLLGAGYLESVRFIEGEEQPADVLPGQSVKIGGFMGGRKRGFEETEEEEDEGAKLPALWTRKLRGSAGGAVVVLKDETSVRLALKKMGKTTGVKYQPTWGLNLPSTTEPLGPIWIMEHLQLCRPDRAEIQASVHSFFTAYNAREASALATAKRLRNEPDEDGFVTVTKGSRSAPASKVEAEAARDKMLEREKKKKETMVGFYRYQVRERRKKEQTELIKRFEGDKKRVDLLREKRGRFKPEN